METATIASLITRARQVADAETATPADDFVTDSEALGYVQTAYRELLDLIIDNGGIDALTTVVSIPNNGDGTFTLPVTNYRSVGVDIPDTTSPAGWRPIGRFMFRERYRRSGWGEYGDGLVQYKWRIVGDNLLLDPGGANPTTVRYWFVESSDTTGDTSVSTFGGWDDYLYLRVAIDFVDKEERDNTALIQKLMRAQARIVSACKDLSSGEPERVTRVQFMDQEIEDAADRGIW